MNNLDSYKKKLKDISKKYLNNEISYEEFKEQTLDLTNKIAPIARVFKSEIEVNEDYPNTLNFGPKGQLA